MGFENNPGAQEYRNFHIGDILSITTGRLVSPRLIEGVYDILDYMTGDELMTHQLPRAAEECAPSLREQHPDLADVDVPEKFAGKEHVDRWLGDLVLQHGETRTVRPLDAGEHRVMDPIVELSEMLGGSEKIVVVQPEPLPPIV